MLINGYPEGSNLTLLNATYVRKKKIKDGWSKEFIDLLYKDEEGRKRISHIVEPEYEYYKAKEPQSYWNFFLPKEDVIMKTCKAGDIDLAIAKETGKESFFFDNCRAKNRGANRALHLDFNILNSDFNIEDHFRFRFAKEYTNNNYDINKSYFDIEVDTIEIEGDRMVESGEKPINAISFIDEKSMKVYSLLLRTPGNEQIQQAEQELANNTLVDKILGIIKKQVGGRKPFIRYGLNKLDYKILFYNDEISLINDFFKILFFHSPDFLLAWNEAFDLPYIHDRIRELGYDPLSIMCPKEIPEKNRYFYYHVDQDNINELEERCDYCNWSSKIVAVDQMIHFASRRKGQPKFISYSLDSIAYSVAKIHKLNYSHLTTRIAKLPYIDYILFIAYNLMDTICQFCIESITGDIDYLYSKCLINCTRYNKGHRQTVYLRNRGNLECYRKGLIMGNNNNCVNEKPTTKYNGAFVGDPRLITDYSKSKVNGVPVYIFDNLDDFDFARLYPSCAQQDNIAPNTQIGMLDIADDTGRVHKLDKYDTPMAFVEDLQTRNWTIIGKRWFGLADFKELIGDIKEYLGNEYEDVEDFKRVDKKTGLISPVFIKNKNIERDPVYFRDINKSIPVVFINKVMPTGLSDSIYEEIEGRKTDVKSIFTTHPALRVDRENETIEI